MKLKDEEADARRNPVWTQPESVLIGRTVDQVATDEADEDDEDDEEAGEAGDRTEKGEAS